MATGKMPFTAHTIEELEARDAVELGTPPIEPIIPTDPQVTDPTKVTPPVTQVTPPTTPPVEQVKSATADWLSEVNKSYKTEFKTPEEFGQVFEKTKKVGEYETKLKGYEDSEKKYQQQIAELNSSLNPLEYFSSQEAFVAEQLRKQYRDLNPNVLYEIATTDTKVMSDLQVLIKNKLLENPNLIGGERGAEELVLDDFGIDPTIPKEEWSTTQQNKILVASRTARRSWDELKSKVTVPKIQTFEEKESERTKLVAEKQVKLAPIKDTFSKFDKFTEEIEEGKTFEFNVPDEYKEVLPAMFDTYFLEAGLDANQDTLKSMETLKRAMLLESNFKQIYKTIEGDVRTRVKAEYDALLNNTTPPNTKTATELEQDDHEKFSNEFGIGKMLGKK